MGLLKVFLLLAIMVISVGSTPFNLPFEVNNPRVQSCSTQFSIESTSLTGIKRGDEGSPCSGYVMAHQYGEDRRLCATDENDFYDKAAKRLCYTTGDSFYRSTSSLTSNTRQIMLYSCFVYREQGVDKVGSDSSEYIFEEEGQLEPDHEYGCEANPDTADDFQCYDDCHIEGGVSSNVEEGGCAYNEPYLAVGCADINECVNGVYDNCTGPFESSCIVRKACGNYTECVNHVGSYECSCMYGFESQFGSDLDPYNIYAGCQDTDECDHVPEVCGHYGECVNTPGSYLCICPSREIWDKEARTCSGPVCGSPAVDPNAHRVETNGQPGDLATYTCLPGFMAPDGSDTYTNLCAEGKWQQSGRCTDKNECGTAVCDVDADCFNTNGHLICTCKKGFKGDGAKCDRVTCDPLPHIRHASLGIPIPQTPAFGDVLIYSCEKGYQVSIKNLPYNLVSYYGYTTTNSFQLTCNPWGQWEPFPLPQCLPVFCGDPGMVAQAERLGAGQLYEQEVWYKCKKGYHLEVKELGEDGFKRTCQSDGTWSKGTRCVDTNECEETPLICGSDKYCVNVPGTYLCSCVPWYEKDTNDAQCSKWAGRGTFSDYKPCQILRDIGFCVNGDCNVVDGYARCTCETGYTGVACDQPVYGGPLITALVFLLAVIILMFFELAYIFYHVVRKTDCSEPPTVVPLRRVTPCVAPRPVQHRPRPPRCPPPVYQGRSEVY